MDRNLNFESGVDLIVNTGDRMRLARTKAHIEQEEMADILNVSVSTISNWENGRVNVKPVMLSAWAQITGFNTSSLIAPPVAED